MNVTIDDVSPVIQYLSANNTWLLGAESQASYFDSSFHATTTDGDQAVVRFNGTACYVFGSNWDNHGAYSAQLDDLPVEYFLGFSADRKFQQVIYSATGLDANAEHTVTLTNLPSKTDPPPNATIEWFFDVDYVIITTATTGQVYTSIFDDSDDVFTYGPGWTANTAQKTPPYYELTMHLTDQTNAQAEFRFNGTSVALYGGVNANHGNFTIAIDGVTGPSTSGRHTTLVDVPLFFASNLEDGPHVMTITNVVTDQPDLDIDYAVVNSTINPQNGNTTTSFGSPSKSSGTSGSAGETNEGNVTLSGEATGSSHSAASHAGTIAGGVMGGLIGVALVFALAWWLFRKRARPPMIRASLATPKEIGRIDLNGPPVERYGGEEVKPYPIVIPAYTGSYPVSYAASRSTSSATSDTHYQSSQQVHSAESGYLSSIPPPPASTATSYVHSERRTSDVPTVPPVPRSVASVRTANTGGVAVSDSPTDESPTGARIKGAMVAVPYTAQIPAQWGANRLVREDREQDAGPAGMFEAEAARRVTLPPDYEQATEPLPGQVPPVPSSREDV